MYLRLLIIVRKMFVFSFSFVRIRIMCEMGPLEIFLLILAIAFVAYLAFFVYVFVSLLSFRGKLNHRLTAFSVLLKEKKDVLSSLYSELDAKNIEMDSATKASCAKMCWLRIDALKENEIKPILLTVSDLQKRLTLLVSQNESLKDDQDIKRFLSTLLDIDSNYRKIVAVYNSEIIGYEYWRKMWLYRPFLYLFGFRERTRLN